MDSVVVNRLLELTKKSDSKIAVAAIHALGEGGPITQEVIDRLVEISKKSDAELQLAGISALGRIFRRRK